MHTLVLAGSLKCVTGLAGLAGLARVDTTATAAADAMALRVVADGAIRGAVLLAATAVVASLLKRSSAATRHLVWCLGLIGALTLVALPPLPPSWHLHVAVVPPELAQSIKGPVSSGASPTLNLPPATDSSRPGHSDIDFVSPAPGLSGASRAAAPAVPPAPAFRPSPWPLRLALLWLVGALVAMTRVLLGVAATARLARQSARVSEPVWTQLVRSLSQALGVRRRVTLYRGEPSAMPLTFGILRPALLLPEEAVPRADDSSVGTWSDERRRVVLLHELAHVKRRDCLTQLVARLACCVHWFNPLAWLAARRLRIEREQACDDLVLTARGHRPRPSDYAAHLLSIARSRSARRGLAAAVGVAMARPSQLEGRLLAVLDAGRDRRAPGKLATASAVASLLLLLLPLALLRVTRADDGERQSARAADRATNPARLPVDGTTPFIGDLPSGGRIELVAVSEHPSKDKAWWSPDGSPLRGRHKAGFVTFVSPLDTQGRHPGPTRARELVLRLTDMPPGATYPRWRTSQGETLSYYGGEAWPADDVANKPKGETRDWRASAAAVPADAESIDLQVGVAAGPWETLAENPAAEAGVRPVSGKAAGRGIPILKDLPHLGPLFQTGNSPPEPEEVKKRLAELEKHLGADETGRLTIYNGKQIQLDRLGQERDRIAAELSRVQARLTPLVKDLEAGRTPPEVEREINRTGRYVGARQQVDEVDITIEQLGRKFGPGHDQVVQRKKLRETLQAKADEIREELKSNYAELMKNELRNDEAAIQANAARVDRLITDLTKQVDQQRKIRDEYRTLKALEADLRRKPAGASFTKGFETDGNTVVSVAHGLTDHEVRIVAVGENGQETAAASNDTRTTDGVGQTTATFAKLSPRQIKSFRLQARPYEWVEFRGVVLSPKTKEKAEKEKAEKAARDRAAGAGLGDDGEAMLRVRHEQLLVLKKSLQDAEEMLAQAEEDLKRAEREAAANKEPTIEDWARVDPTMEGQVRMRSEQLFRHSSLEAQLGEKHPTVVRSVEDLKTRNDFMNKYAEELNAKYVIRWKPERTGGTLIPRDLSGLRASVKRLREVYESEAAAVNELAARRARLGN